MKLREPRHGKPKHELCPSERPSVTQELEGADPRVAPGGAGDGGGARGATEPQDLIPEHSGSTREAAVYHRLPQESLT